MPPTSLHIEVLEKERPKVGLEFGARAGDRLRELVPAELRPKLSARGVELAMISENCGATGSAASELFAICGRRQAMPRVAGLKT